MRDDLGLSTLRRTSVRDLLVQIGDLFPKSICASRKNLNSIPRLADRPIDFSRVLRRMVPPIQQKYAATPPFM